MAQTTYYFFASFTVSAWPFQHWKLNLKTTTRTREFFSSKLRKQFFSSSVASYDLGRLDLAWLKGSGVSGRRGEGGGSELMLEGLRALTVYPVFEDEKSKGSDKKLVKRKSH